MKHELFCAMLLGFLLDCLLGDPRTIPHPVVCMGRLISWLEKAFRALFPKTKLGENLAGGCIWLVTVAVSFLIPWGLLKLAGMVSPWLRLLLQAIFCWQVLAAKSLRQESMKVYEALKTGTIEDARYAVSMIVGRDTQALDADAVTRAAVETVAENCSDGVIAPMLYFALGGGPLAFAYKAVNTMDSMLGYVEPPYQNVGLVPAKMDDVFNFLPARLSGLLMLAAGALLGMDGKNGWKIFCRDRYNHASPNSAQTEAVCAGLLDLRLAGDAWYHGVLHKKKFIGDPIREIEDADIPRACRLLYATAFLGLVLFAGLKFCFLF